ncbi:hypothetical protein NQ315_007841 [Exocentrus adspersus]|uniref:SHSP domain-containing protein n=1 Tax=Exocentrus adspersus TaxID=1586481 RepID=A0AAV8W9A5_9CUCU|nr:hypothetical protein NQ315_007841 [Exocentrus adspersus]
MSLLPYLLDDTHFLRPSRLLDQHFGLALDADDFLQPLTVPRMVIKCPAGYLRNWRSGASQQDTGSTVTSNKDKFEANLDVQQFKPEEISVKVTGENTITVEGKHEEKEDEHGHIYRHFVRRYVLPKNCDMGKIESKLSSDGILTITAPKAGADAIEHKEIPVTHTGAPAKAVEQGEAGDKK